MAADKVKVNEALTELARTFRITLPDYVMLDLERHVVDVFDEHNEVAVYVLLWAPVGDEDGCAWFGDLGSAIHEFQGCDASVEPLIKKVKIPGGFDPLNDVDRESIAAWLQANGHMAR